MNEYIRVNGKWMRWPFGGHGYHMVVLRSWRGSFPPGLLSLVPPEPRIQRILNGLKWSHSGNSSLWGACVFPSRFQRCNSTKAKCSSLSEHTSKKEKKTKWLIHKMPALGAWILWNSRLSPKPHFQTNSLNWHDQKAPSAIVQKHGWGTKQVNSQSLTEKIHGAWEIFESRPPRPLPPFNHCPTNAETSNTSTSWKPMTPWQPTTPMQALAAGAVCKACFACST